MFTWQQPQERIFNHSLDTILPEDDDSLDWPTVVADSVKDILYIWIYILKKSM